MLATANPEVLPSKGLFRRGMRLVSSYIRLHPGPFLVSVAGAAVFAIASIALTSTIAHVSDTLLQPAFVHRVTGEQIALACVAILITGGLRAAGIMVRRYYSGVGGERVMATLRTRVSDRYRELALAYHRGTPTGELLAHMEADVKAAVDVYWPVPFAVGVVFLVVLAIAQMLATDFYLALTGLVLFPTLALMYKGIARRMEGPDG